MARTGFPAPPDRHGAPITRRSFEVVQSFPAAGRWISGEGSPLESVDPSTGAVHAVIGTPSAAEVGAPHERLRIFILAHAGRAELEGLEPGQHHPRRWQVPDGPAALPGGTGLHPPGPGDRAGWAAVLAARPDLAPALGFDDCLAWARRMSADPEGPVTAAAEPVLRRMADGLAHRARALRLLGNGVHPLAAAHAWRSLAAAHGLGPVDLAADGCGSAPGADGFP